MITVFNIKSNITADIVIQPGTTVDALKSILVQKGYDVHEATVTVNRLQEGDRLKTPNASYELQEGDTIEFFIDKCHVPNLLNEVAPTLGMTEMEAIIKEGNECPEEVEDESSQN